MPADEKVQRVMTRIGVWTPDERCFDMNCDHYATPHSYHSAPHDIPCPDPSDPAIVVAMLEWAYSMGFRVATAKEANEYAVMLRCLFGPAAKTQAQSIEQPTLAAALIDAIDSLPED